MSATGSVNVVVAAVEAVVHRVDPAPQLDGDLDLALIGNRTCCRSAYIPALGRKSMVKLARRQQNDAAVRAR